MFRVRDLVNCCCCCLPDRRANAVSVSRARQELAHGRVMARSEKEGVKFHNVRCRCPKNLWRAPQRARARCPGTSVPLKLVCRFALYACAALLAANGGAEAAAVAATATAVTTVGAAATTVTSTTKIAAADDRMPEIGCQTVASATIGAAAAAATAVHRGSWVRARPIHATTRRLSSTSRALRRWACATRVHGETSRRPVSCTTA